MAEPISFWDLPPEDVYDPFRNGQGQAGDGTRFPHYLIAYDAYVSTAGLDKLYPKRRERGGGLGVNDPRATGPGLEPVLHPCIIGQALYYPWLGDLTDADVEFALNFKHEFGK